MMNNEPDLRQIDKLMAYDDDHTIINDAALMNSRIGDLSPTGESTPPTPTPTIKPWKILEKRLLIDRHPWLKLYEHSVALPDGRVIHDFHHLDIPDHVVIYPRTADNMVATLCHYRHGLGRVTTTLPGGMVEANEHPFQAAKRELCEETGLASERWYLLGKYRVNGNLGCGDGYYYLADNCYFIAQADSGDIEESRLEWQHSKRLTEMLHAGEQPLMHHALAIALVRSFESDP